MNEKLVINANLLRKEPEFGTRVCVVEKADIQFGIIPLYLSPKSTPFVA